MRALFAAASVCAEAALFCALPFAAYLPLPPGIAYVFCLIVIPLALFPAACFALGFASGAASGFSVGQALLSGAVFIPAALMHYGSPAIYHALLYSAASTAGLLFGGSVYLIRKA